MIEREFVRDVLDVEIQYLSGMIGRVEDVYVVYNDRIEKRDGQVILLADVPYTIKEKWLKKYLQTAHYVKISIDTPVNEGMWEEYYKLFDTIDKEVIFESAHENVVSIRKTDEGYLTSSDNIDYDFRFFLSLTGFWEYINSLDTWYTENTVLFLKDKYDKHQELISPLSIVNSIKKYTVTDEIII